MLLKRQLVREITATILLVVFYRACSQVSIPFINQQALTAVFDGNYFVSGLKPDHISILSLGLMPYMSAYVLVEIASLLIPFLKKLRHDGYSGRRKLKRYALCTTLVVAVWQATALINGLSEFTTAGGVPILDLENHIAYAILVLIFVAGVFFLIIVSELISVYGIGNGISIIILSGIGASATLFGVDLSRLFNLVGLFPFFLSFSVIFLAAVPTIILVKTKVNNTLKHRKSDQPVNFFQLTLCPSGNVAIFFATSAVMLPATLEYIFRNSENLAATLTPGSFFYNFLLVIFICIFSYLFAWLFFHPTRRLDKMDERGWYFPEDRQVTHEYLTRRLIIYNLPWTLLLCVLAIIPHILIANTRVPFYIGGSRLIIAFVISLDIIARFNVLRRLRSDRLTKIAELQDVYDASMITEHLRSERIVFHLQGFYHRHLLYFFGPYIDISLMVAEGDKEPAQEIIRTYYNGSGLV